MRKKKSMDYTFEHICVGGSYRALKGRRNTVANRHCQYGLENTISIELIDGMDEISERGNEACVELSLDVRGDDVTERHCLEDEKENHRSRGSGKPLRKPAGR